MSDPLFRSIRHIFEIGPLLSPEMQSVKKTTKMREHLFKVGNTIFLLLAEGEGNDISGDLMACHSTVPSTVAAN